MNTLTFFEDTKTAFKLKNNSELRRAYFLFKIIKNKALVRIGTTLVNFAVKLHLPIETVIRKTVFNHFCGGIDEVDCSPLIKKMYKAGGVYSVLDYSVEAKTSEDQFDHSMNKTLQLLDYAFYNKAIPFVVFKPSGFGRLELWQKTSEGVKLTKEEIEEWLRIENRFYQVCKRASEYKIPVLIDSEESWMQDSADQLVEEMMSIFNRGVIIVYNTFQLYRHDRLPYLKNLNNKAKSKGFKVGAKIVRGAYIEKENYRALKKGYPSPICTSKAATDDNFNATLTYILNNLDNISIFIGSHNEQSNLLALKIMTKLGIKKNDARIWFGQLYGMSDHISYNLAEEGYNVSKYLPFGPVRDVMPYLIRRAEENTSVVGQTGRELNLLMKEKNRRKL